MHSVRYDPSTQILEVDASGIKATPAVIDQILDDIIAVAKSAGCKPIVLTCWTATDLDLASAKRYGERMEDLKPLIRTVVRYGNIDTMTKTQVRAESVKHKLSRTQFFETREEALAAIREGRVG